MAAEELLVQGLEKSFGDLIVLQGLSLRVTPGQILGFLGRNGAGKTTTMRCIFGLLDPDAGTVSYGGRELSRSVRRSFGYMPEERGLYPKMAIITQLVHFARLAGMARSDARDAATAWLDRLDLAERAGDNLETLSHGNQQRVQLAAALVHGPEVLVLDEPFSGLDPVGVAQMGAVLREAASRGATILFSSHQLDLVEGLCVDVAIIKDGRTVASGDLATIRARAGHRRVEVLVGGRPWVPEGVGTVRIDGERTHVLVPDTVPAEQLLAAASATGTVTSFRYGPPSLADLFHEAVAPLPERELGSRARPTPGAMGEPASEGAARGMTGRMGGGAGHG